jgi:hypothetical protein
VTSITPLITESLIRDLWLDMKVEIKLGQNIAVFWDVSRFGGSRFIRNGGTYLTSKCVTSDKAGASIKPLEGASCI